MNNLTRAEPEPDTDMPRFEADAVHQPAHYANNIIEPVTFINANGINFNRGNAIKYLVRAGKKEPAKELEDLRKAARYIEIEMECIRRRADVADGMDAKDVWKVAL